MPLAKNGEKQCSTCKRVYSPPSTGFHRNVKARDGLQNVCKPCQASHTRHWKHGLKTGEIDRMMAEQGGRCAICGKATELVLDHGHRSGVIRGLLCRLCNSMLGMCDDEVGVLKRAIDYITAKGR